MFIEYPWPSFGVLKHKLNSYFKGKPFCIVAQGCKLKIPDEKVIHVVLLGDGIFALHTFLHAQIDKHFYLWVLSTAHAKLLSKILKIPREYIGVIPRYDLFPLKCRSENIPQQGTPLSLISSTSFAKNKNFEFCIAVMSRAQKLIGNIDCFVCGPNMENDLKKIKDIIAKYQWVSPPTLLGDLGTRWINYDFLNPVLLNFSTSVYEDYGVSIAQAQTKGWPLVISKWGAHHDVQGKHVVKVPHQWIVKKQVGKVARLLSRLHQSEYFIAPSATRPKLIRSGSLKIRIKTRDIEDLKYHCYGFKKNRRWDRTISKILGGSV